MTLPYGTKIRMHSTEPFPGLVGFIVGLSTQEQPVIGAGYIIETYVNDRNTVDKTMLSHQYPYTHFVAFHCQFDVMEES